MAKKNKFTRKKQTGGMYAYGMMPGMGMMNNGYGTGYPYGSMISSGGGRKKVYKSTKSRRSKVGGTSKTRGKPRKSRRRKN